MGFRRAGDLWQGVDGDVTSFDYWGAAPLEGDCVAMSGDKWYSFDCADPKLAACQVDAYRKLSIWIHIASACIKIQEGVNYISLVQSRQLCTSGLVNELL